MVIGHIFRSNYVYPIVLAHAGFGQLRWQTLSLVQSTIEKIIKIAQLGVLKGVDFRYRKLVGATGFEPATPCTPCKCATRLRYAPRSVISEMNDTR